MSERETASQSRPLGGNPDAAALAASVKRVSRYREAVDPRLWRFCPPVRKVAEVKSDPKAGILSQGQLRAAVQPAAQHPPWP